jgi:3-hydroxyacyl-CoA dehydrogenase
MWHGSGPHVGIVREAMSEDQCWNRRVEFAVEVGRKIVAVCQVVGFCGESLVLQLVHVIDAWYGRHFEICGEIL